MTKDQEIKELQTLTAHQDKQIQELNEIVTRQWAEIDALKKYMQITKSKLQELEHNMSEMGQGENMSVTDEAAANKPPHY